MVCQNIIVSFLRRNTVYCLVHNSYLSCPREQFFRHDARNIVEQAVLPQHPRCRRMRHQAVLVFTEDVVRHGMPDQASKIGDVDATAGRQILERDSLMQREFLRHVEP